MKPVRIYKVKHADGSEESVIGDKVYFSGGLLEIELKGQKQAIFTQWVQVTPGVPLLPPEFAIWEKWQAWAVQRGLE